MKFVDKYISSVDTHMKEVLGKASSALLIRVLGTVLGFVVSVMIARLLGAEGSGIYFLTVSVVMIASTVGRLGFDNTVVRFIAAHASQKEWANVHFVYRVAIKTTGLASALLSALLFVCASWLATGVFGKPFMEVPLQIGAAAVLPFSLLMIHAECLRGLKKIPSSQWIKTVLISLVCLLLLYPSISLWEANGAVISYAAAVIITAIVAWLLWKRVWVRIEKDQQDSSLSTQKLLQSSWPLFGVALAGLLIQQTATIFLGIWGAPEDVGVFNVASRIASLLLFPLMAMISILTPKFSAMYQQGDIEDLASLARKSSMILFVFALFASTLVGAASSWILGVFGEEFIVGRFALLVLLVGVVVNASTGAVAELLMMTGYERDCRNINIFGATIIISLCLLLIPFYGIIGAATAMTVGLSSKNIIMVFWVKRRLGFWPMGVSR